MVSVTSNLSDLTCELGKMREQLLAKAKEAVILQSAADAIDDLNTDSLIALSLREWAGEAEQQVEQLEHNIADAMSRRAIMLSGLPDPGMWRAPL
jgi:hypothetical protein